MFYTVNAIEHPLVVAAADGNLPAWTEAGPLRREHMRRVADLLSEWAEARGLPESEASRWRAAGFLHDVLREAPPEALIRRVAPHLADRLPGPILHGPAAAERLRTEGVLDGEFLSAVAYHTTGHVSFGVLGKALYCADFLEPGRDFEHEWRSELRARAASDIDAVTREIVAARVRHVVGRGMDLIPETVDFWNGLVKAHA